MNCRKCDSPMSRPMRGRRTQLWISTCIFCAHQEHTAERPDFVEPDPDLSLWARKELAPTTGLTTERFGGFDRASVGGELKKNILTRRQLERENANDPKLKQLGGDQ